MSTPKPPPAPVLHAEGVTKAYSGRKVVDGVDLELAPGERVALMGASGSGKSTLLHCLSGVDDPDAGRILIEGIDLATADAATRARLRRERLGNVFQFFHLLPTLTAHENVELPLQLQGLRRADRKKRVRALLAETGVAHRADAFPGQLSGGEMQRVALARALAPRPALIFADEPTGNLDSRSGAAVLELLAQTATDHGIALLLVTHSREATAICTRTLGFRDGRLVDADDL